VLHSVFVNNYSDTVFQAGVTLKYKNDGQRFLLEHLDTIHNSPSQIYHSALPLSPPSWLHECYGAELSSTVKVIKGLPTEWGMCSRTTVLGSYTQTLSYHYSSIAVGSEPGDIIILDTITGIQTAILSEHTEEVNCVVFSLDGTLLVSGSGDNTVKLWDIQTGGVVKTFYGHTDCVLSVSISADCTQIASGSDDHTICLWDIETGGCHHTIKHQDAVYHVRFSPTIPQCLISISENQVWQWGANGHRIKPPFDGHHVSFSPDGTQFVSCHGKTVTVHNSSSGATVTEFQITESAAYSCSFSPDSRLIAVAAGRTVYCWNITSSKPQLVETFVGHTGDITSLVFSSPTTLISASLDKSVKFWYIGAQSADSTVIDPKSKTLPSVPIESITLQAKDSIIITTDSDGIVKTWDISTGINKISFQTPAKSHKRDIQLINDKLILVWHVDKKAHVWDVESGKLLLEVDQLGKHAGFLRLVGALRIPRALRILGGNRSPGEPRVLGGLRISGDGLRFFYLYAPSIWSWSIQTGESVGEVKIGYSGESGPLTVSGSKVWAHWPQSGYQGWDFGISGSAPTQVSGMPTVSSGTMLWDPRQGRIKNAVTGGTVFQLSGRFANPIDVQCDGSYLVAGYESGEILILELKHVLL
jgi:WD40 repeat protein